MRFIYLPETGPAALGRAMFYIAYAYMVQIFRERGVTMPRPMLLLFECVIGTWSFGIVELKT